MLLEPPQMQDCLQSSGLCAAVSLCDNIGHLAAEEATCGLPAALLNTLPLFRSELRFAMAPADF